MRVPCSRRVRHAHLTFVLAGALILLSALAAAQPGTVTATPRVVFLGEPITVAGNDSIDLIDWGDGSAPTAERTHAYAAPGRFVILAGNASVPVAVTGNATLHVVAQLAGAGIVGRVDTSEGHAAVAVRVRLSDGSETYTNETGVFAFPDYAGALPGLGIVAESGTLSGEFMFPRPPPFQGQIFFFAALATGIGLAFWMMRPLRRVS